MNKYTLKFAVVAVVLISTLWSSLSIAGPVTYFHLSGLPLTTESGTTWNNFTVSALDSSNSVMQFYTGTAHFAATDWSAVLPSDYTFTGGGGDNGTHTFSVALHILGMQTISVTDIANAGITGSISTTVISSVAPVPEPETYAMLLAGLGLLGFTARRRKNLAA